MMPKQERDTRPLADSDPEIYGNIAKEKQRQQDHLELIASENFVSAAIQEAARSVLTNKYAEGYPSARYYGGCEHVDAIETLARERLKALFGAQHANVQPHSGSQANAAVYHSCLEPGDTILSMRLEHGGHLTHGYAKNFSGALYNVVHYNLDAKTDRIDYEDVKAKAQKHEPKMIVVGASAYPRTIDFERFGAIAQDCGAYLFADVAHIAGLIVAGLHPNPFPHADFVTSTTHKTLRGPRGGVILCKQAYAKRIDSAVFPGMQGGPLMHIIAAKAVCFLEASRPEFRTYQERVVANAQALAKAFTSLGHRIITGGTDNHLFLIDLSQKYPDLDGKTAQTLLDSAHITCNRNTIPGETRSPFKTSGLRIGTPAITTRGIPTECMPDIASWIDSLLNAALGPEAPRIAQDVRSQVIELCKAYPL